MKSDIEQQILRLKPGPLPADLKQRLQAVPHEETPATQAAAPNLLVSHSDSTPAGNKIHRLWPAVIGIAAAACVAFMIILFSQQAPSANPLTRIDPVDSGDPTTPALISVIHENQTLLDSKTLAIKEHNGQAWELVEEKWRDDKFALCSTVDQQVSSHEIRHELVLRPVKFH